MKKLLKILAYLMLVMTVLVLLLLAFTQTSIFRNWLREQAVIASRHYINGELAVGKLSGNLFRRIELQDASVTLDSVTVASVRTLLIRLNPLALFSKRILISTVVVERPEIDLRQDEAQRWNIERLLKTSKDEAGTPSNGTAMTFGWTVELPDVRINAGSATISVTNRTDSSLPALVRGFNLDLGVWLKHEKVQASLRNLSFESVDPDFRVQTVRSALEYAPDALQASDFTLKTDASEVTGEVEIQDMHNPILDIVLSGRPLSLDEVRRAFPEVKIFGNPQLDVEASGPLDSLAVKCALRLGDGVATVAGRLDVVTEQAAFDLTGAVADFDFAELFNDSAYATDLNLQFEAAGHGFDLSRMNAAFSLQLDSSLVMGERIHRAEFAGAVQNDSLRFTLDSDIGAAVANLTGWLEFGSDLMQYDVSGTLSDLDISYFDSTSGFHSDLDVALSLHGRGFALPTMTADLRADVSPSLLNDVPIDTAAMEFVLEKQQVAVQRFHAASPLGALNLAGHVGLEGETDLNATAEISDLSILAPSVAVDTLAGTGNLNGRVRGQIDSLLISASVAFRQVAAPDVMVADFNANADGFIAETATRFDVSAAVQHLVAFGTQVDTAEFELKYTDDVSRFKLGLALNTGATAGTAGAFQIAGDEYLVDFYDLELALSQHQWQKIGGPCRLRIQGPQYDLSELVLESENQRFMLYGTFNIDGENDLRAKFSDIDLSKYKEHPELDLAGILQFEFFLDGTLSRPKIGGRLRLEHGKYSEFAFEKFSGTFSYSESKFSWHCSLARTAVDSLLESSGRLPIQLSLSPYEADFLPDAPLEFKVSTQGIDLSFLEAFVEGVKDLEGLLVADVVLRNTWNDLTGVGPIRLINGEFRIPEMGTKYEKINVVLVLDGHDLKIRDFGMRSGDGYIRLLEGGLSLSGDTVEKFRAKFKVKNFGLIDNNKMAARASGTVELLGSLQHPFVSGDLTVDQLRVFYQKFEDETAVTLSSTPFFVVSDSTVADTSGALRFQKAKEVKEVLFTETEFYRNLDGEVSVYFPRNAWIRGPNTSIEIEGDVVLVKEQGPDFALFGSLSTRRGFYQLFGNRFRIQTGEMVFNGEPEINPTLNIEAVTTIAEDRGEDKPVKREFTVVITGTLYFPEFKFLLDGNETSQENVVSILLFGQPYDALGHGEKSSGNAISLENRAAGALTGQLVRQLTGKLGDEFSLDVVEIQSDRGDLSQSTVRVGKYVTPDVFVSISQDFGAEGNQIVEFEYEIPKKILFFNLLLQATSDREGDTGMDVIWKIDW